MAGWLFVAFLAVIASLLVIWCIALLLFVHPIVARWREPVFRFPILILESDDWGAGPLDQAPALRRILQLLQEYRDCRGRAAVMTLGIVFEVPDTKRIADDDARAYHGIFIDHFGFDELRDVVMAGIRAGVFIPQLHGSCHYWPESLMSAARSNEDVRAWLTTPGLPRTERLSPSLQSRWIDGSVLPSRPLPRAAIDRAVAAEADFFRRTFGEAPRVAVATAFVWTSDVERAWRREGIDVVITQGSRATLRDAAGQPAGIDRTMLTGDASDAGQCYLVRDVYLEPALGHMPERMVAALADRARQGRACLVEMHRYNFLDAHDISFPTLRTALAKALACNPQLRFVSPQELAMAIRDRDSDLLERRLRGRLKAWVQRLEEIPRFARVARMTGLAFPLRMLAGAV